MELGRASWIGNVTSCNNFSIEFQQNNNNKKKIHE